VPVELGASWVHDTAASDLADLLAEAGVAGVPFDYRGRLLDDDGGESGESGEPGEPLDRDEVFAVAAETVELAVEWADTQDQDRSLADAIEQSGAADDTGVAADVLDAYLDGEITTEYGASADELSAWWGLAEGSEGDDLFVTGGYDTLARSVAAELDVRLGTAVRSVSWSDRATVGLADGGQLVADQVVVTVPLGVLQAGTIEFDPPLPDEVRSSVDALGMGLLDKYWFRFEERFWPEGSLMWTRIDPPGEPFAEWFDLAEVTGEPVLLALLGGPTAREWEQRSDDEVLAAVQPALDDLASLPR
jgi:monoamine oxidase